MVLLMQDSAVYEYTSMKNLNESKYGFWGVLARKAKAILEEDDTTKQLDPGRNQPQAVNTSAGSQVASKFASHIYWLTLMK